MRIGRILMIGACVAAILAGSASVAGSASGTDQVTVYGYLDRPDLANSPIRVDEFRVLPGGKLDGEFIGVEYDRAIIGPVRELPDGGVIIDDQYGNGHRLLPSDGPNAVSAATIASYVGQMLRLPVTHT